MSNNPAASLEQKEKTPLWKMITSLFGIITLRVFLENFSSPDQSGYFFHWRDAFLQFPLYYCSVFLSFAILLRLFTKKNLDQILDFEIKIFLFTLIPTLADLLVTLGRGAAMSYVITEPAKFLFTFFKLMDPRGFMGITFGIHVAAYLILFFMASYTYKATKSSLKALNIAVVGYVVLFCYAVTPSLIALPQMVFGQEVSAVDAYMTTLDNSWIITTKEKVSFLSRSFDLQISQNEPITQLLFLYIFFQLGLLLALSQQKFWRAFKKNMRLERVLFWFFIAATGMIIAQNSLGTLHLLNMMNIISLGVFAALIALSAWLAVSVNDLEDVAIDTISNPNRPLVTKEISLQQWRNMQVLLLLLLIFGTALMNHAVAFLFVLAQLCYYIYSVKPLYLKRHFISSSLLIGSVSVIITMAGFFLVSSDQHLAAFPLKTIFLVGAAFALISGFKDLKDYQGDKAGDIRTLPVIFGLEKSKKIIAGLFMLVFVTVPLVLGLSNMLAFSFVVAVFSWYLFTKKVFVEKQIFILIFLYMAALLIFSKL